jgi:hypothetical protein
MERFFNYPLRQVYDAQPDKRTDVIFLITRYYDSLEEDGVLSKCFHDIAVESVQDFTDVVFNPQNLFYLIVDMEDGSFTPVGHAMLTNFYGKAAMVHFSIIKARWGQEARRIAEESLNQVSRIIPNLIGIIPTSNRIALAFARRMGFKELATLKGVCYMAKTDTYEDGVMSLWHK